MSEDVRIILVATAVFSTLLLARFVVMPVLMVMLGY